MKNIKNEANLTKQIAIDPWIHKMIKIKAIESGKSLRSFVEGYFIEILEVKTKNQST